MQSRFKLQFLAFYAVLSACILSCKQHPTTPKYGHAFLGGEIVNPINNLVILRKGNMVLDTLKLDANNRFIYKIDSVDNKLYTFLHGGEHQFVMLEPNDSIMFRLNTLEFDESLVFTGKGAKKNNYLINTFLLDETHEGQLLKYCQSSPKQFNNITDSLKQIKQQRLQRFVKKHKPSKTFTDLAQANIDYNFYAQKEVYPFMHSGNKAENLDNLPDNFYDYRSKIDYNHENLSDYYWYKSFLRQHFKNLALKKQITQTNLKFYQPSSINFNLNTLDVIDSLVKNKIIKDELLTRTFYWYVNTCKTPDNNIKMLESYVQKVTNKNYKEKAKRRVKALTNLKIGKHIPNTYLLTLNKDTTSLKQIIDKPTMIYFWSYNYKEHFKESHIKAQKLQEKYPKLNIVAININNNTSDYNKNVLKRYGFSSDNEYQFNNPSIAKDSLAINAINKVVLVDNKGIIKDNNANMFSFGFEGKVKQLIR